MTLVKVNQHPVHKGFNNFFDEILNEFPAFGAREWTKNGFGTVPVNIHETADAYCSDEKWNRQARGVAGQ